MGVAPRHNDPKTNWPIGGIAHGLLHLHSVVFCLCFVYCMIVLFVDNLFFYLGGQSVSCKASLAALRLYGYFCDIVVMMLLSENKYDDDDDDHKSTLILDESIAKSCFSLRSVDALKKTNMTYCAWDVCELTEIQNASNVQRGQHSSCHSHLIWWLFHTSRVERGLDLSMDWIGLDWIGSNLRDILWIGLGHVVAILTLSS